MDNRRFGVEIECGSPWRGGWDSEEKTADLLRRKGFSEWAGYIHHDGTDVEIHSPILQGRRGFEELRRVMRFLRNNDFYTTSRDGLHIHHDAPEFVDNYPLVERAAKGWLANQNLINEFVAPRRRTSSHCPGWSEAKIRDLGNLKEEFAARYYSRDSFNITSLEAHGTIEIRLLEGTLDDDLAVAWIKFGQKFLAGVLKRKNPICYAETPEVLLNRLRVGKRVKSNMRPFRTTTPEEGVNRELVNAH